MSYQELYDWYEYYMNEPFFSDRIEMQLATISMLISSFGGGKGNKPKHADFMIRKPEKAILSKEQKTKQLITAFKSM
jgi:hypothetical protein